MDRSEVHQFLWINDFGGEPKTGRHYLTIVRTASAQESLLTAVHVQPADDAVTATLSELDRFRRVLKTAKPALRKR
jgi:hypothetical protein